MLNSKNLLTTRNMPASNLIAPVKSLLIAKQAPVGISAYHELGKKYGLQVEFMRLTSVIPMSIDEFKHHRLLISQCDSLIFNSSHVVDHFFQLRRAVRAKMPTNTRYYCSSLAVAARLKKYLRNQKRRVYTSKTLADFGKLLVKHGGKKILFFCTNTPNNKLLNMLKSIKCKYQTLAICNVAPATNLANLPHFNYDMVTLFSPITIPILEHTLSRHDLQPSSIRLATFGESTTRIAMQKGWSVAVKAPTKEHASMTAALMAYLNQTNS